jgi:hypothetical protein
MTKKELVEIKKLWNYLNAKALKKAQELQPDPMIVEADYGNGKIKRYYVPEGLCGFGGVVVKDRKLINRLKKIGVSVYKSYSYGGYYIPAPHILGQSYERQKKWAEVIAIELTRLGYEAFVDARLD